VYKKDAVDSHKGTKPSKHHQHQHHHHHQQQQQQPIAISDSN